MTITPAMQELMEGLVEYPGLNPSDRYEIARRAERAYDTSNEVLAEEVRAFVRGAMAEANRILERGTPAIKVRLIAAVFSRLVSLLGQEESSDLNEMRGELATILEAVRDTGT